MVNLDRLSSYPNSKDILQSVEDGIYVLRTFYENQTEDRSPSWSVLIEWYDNDKNEIIGYIDELFDFQTEAQARYAGKALFDAKYREKPGMKIALAELKKAIRDGIIAYQHWLVDPDIVEVYVGELEHKLEDEAMRLAIAEVYGDIETRIIERGLPAYLLNMSIEEIIEGIGNDQDE